MEYILQVGSQGMKWHHWLGNILNDHSKLLLKKAGIAPGMTIIEYGAGQGEMTLWLAEQVGPAGQVWAVDKYQEQLAIIEQRAKEAGIPNITTLCADIEELPVSLPPAHMVYGRLILIHTAEPSRVLQRTYQQLLPGGCYVFDESKPGELSLYPETPFYRPLQEKLHYIFSNLASHISADVAEHIYSLMAEQGFEIEYGCIFYPLLSLDQFKPFTQCALSSFIGRMQTFSTHSKEIINQIIHELLLLPPDRLFHAAVSKQYHVVGRKRA